MLMLNRLKCIIVYLNLNFCISQLPIRYNVMSCNNWLRSILKISFRINLNQIIKFFCSIFIVAKAEDDALIDLSDDVPDVAKLSK